MAIDLPVDIQPSQLWPQHDARDPLGIWAARLLLTGDATGNPIRVEIRVPENRRAAHVFCCYSVTAAQLTGAVTPGSQVRCRLLSNWPDASTVAGITGYATLVIRNIVGTAFFGAPQRGPDGPLLNPFDRFIFMYDPRPLSGNIAMVEIEWDDNVNAATYAFEAYGYYWDRAVMSTPGGPRHPGSS